MIDEKQLQNFIIKKFIKTLVIIGVIQLFNNILFSQVFNPMLSHMLGADVMNDAGVREGIWIMLQLLFARLFSPRISVGAFRFVENVFHVRMDNSIYDYIDLKNATVSDWQSATYLLIVCLCLLVMLVLWTLPYFIGGIRFAVSVSKKVKELEYYRFCEQKEAEKQKNLLLSDVAHDIKTPITTIAGFSQALAEGTVPQGKEAEYLEAIRSKSMQTVDMVTLLFEYVKLDSKGFVLHKSREDVCELFRGCIANAYADFEAKDMELDLDIQEESIMLNVDKLQLERAFHNILTNAIRHNKNGTKIWITQKVDKDELSFQISDDGVRIETETAKHLFDPFVQGDKSRTTGKGTGLGLSITRKIVEMHGGRVRLIQYKNPDPYTKTFEIILKTS